MRIAMYQPDQPPSVGAMIRLAACLGLPLDIVEPCGFPLSDRALKRVAMDYIRHAEVVRHPSWDHYRTQRAPGRLVLLTTRGAVAHHDFRYAESDTLLLGRESIGAPPEVHAAADARVVVPLRPGIRSLNIVVAAAIVAGEALRQINGFAPQGPIENRP